MTRIVIHTGRVLARATLSFVVALGFAAPVSALAIGSVDTSTINDSNDTSEITVNILTEGHVANEGRDIALTDEQIQEALRQGVEGMSAITEPYADIFRSAPDGFYGDLALDNQQSINLLSSEDTKRLISIEGANRYETAARIVQKAFPDEQSLTSGWAIVASGESWPDALAATALAGGLDCPILLTNKDILPAETEDELIRLGVGKVIIVGGKEVVSDVVKVTLNDNGNRTVLRLSGDNRYQTAEAIFTYGKTAGVGGSSLWDNTAIIASGVTFADALAISPIAFSQKIPMASEYWLQRQVV